MTRRLAWFVAVGCAAAATHFSVVLALVRGWDARPLVANVGGWAVAFCVSFAGHWNLTFRASGAPLAQAVTRFFLVSLAGFLANELAYALLLHLGGLRYDVALGIVLVGIAVMTYLLSSRWAFRRTPG